MMSDRSSQERNESDESWIGAHNQVRLRRRRGMTDSEWQILDLSGRWIDAPSKEAAIGCIKDGTATAIALSRLASSDGGVKGEPEPVAWQYELATYRCNETGVYSRWVKRISDSKPNVPEGSIRNLTPLYTAPPADAGMREALEKVATDFDIKASMYTPGLQANKNNPYAPRMCTAFLSAAAQIRAISHAALAASATTKSDVEALAATTAERPGTVTSEPEPSTSDPSSTRSEVTVEFGELVDDLLSVTAEVRRQNWKNGGAHLYDDEDAARKITRALLDQFEIRRK